MPLANLRIDEGGTQAAGETAIGADASGNISGRSRGLYSRRSTDGGATWDASVPIVTGNTEKPVDGRLDPNVEDVEASGDLNTAWIRSGDNKSEIEEAEGGWNK